MMINGIVMKIEAGTTKNLDGEKTIIIGEM
jgi:hypothetical protein